MHMLENHPPSQILPFETAWRNLEGMTLTEISQMQEGQYGTSFVHVGSRTWERTEAASTMLVTRGRGEGNGQMVVKGTEFQSCGVSEFWRLNAQQPDRSQQYRNLEICEEGQF